MVIKEERTREKVPLLAMEINCLYKKRAMGVTRSPERLGLHSWVLSAVGLVA